MSLVYVVNENLWITPERSLNFCLLKINENEQMPLKVLFLIMKYIAAIFIFVPQLTGPLSILKSTSHILRKNTVMDVGLDTAAVSK